MKRPVGHATRICYGCSHEERRRRQLGHGRRGQQNRGRREADDVVDLVDMEGASPDDKIEETLPIEVNFRLFSDFFLTLLSRFLSTIKISSLARLFSTWSRHASPSKTT